MAAAVLTTTRQHNINANFIRMIQNIYDKALGAIIADEGSKPEILARIAEATAALAKFKTIWNDRNVALSSKNRLMHSLVMSIFSYACEYWTQTAYTERRIQKAPRHHLQRSHLQRRGTNQKSASIGPHEDLLTTVKRRKLKWYGHK